MSPQRPAEAPHPASSQSATHPSHFPRPADTPSTPLATTPSASHAESHCHRYHAAAHFHPCTQPYRPSQSPPPGTRPRNPDQAAAELAASSSPSDGFVSRTEDVSAPPTEGSWSYGPSNPAPPTPQSNHP